VTTKIPQTMIHAQIAMEAAALFLLCIAPTQHPQRQW
jgi:hypothetical protein